MENFNDTFAAANSPLKIGQKAPNFDLVSTTATPHQKISLHDFRGLPVILAFYPSDWSPICGNLLAHYNKIMPEFKQHEARLLGISVDNFWSHLAFSRNNNIGFPLLSDFEPKGLVAKSYGVFDTKTGMSLPALFIINSQGHVHWSHLSPLEDMPGTHELLEALDLLPKQLTYRVSHEMTAIVSKR